MAEHKIQNNSRLSAIFRAFQPDGRLSYFLVGHSVQAKSFKSYITTCMVWIEIFLQSIRIVSYFLCQKDEQTSSYMVILAVRSITQYPNTVSQSAIVVGDVHVYLWLN